MQENIKTKLFELYESVGQHFTDLLVSLLAMVIVARNFNISGFGVFSYLVALYQIVSFISEAGICDRFRNKHALSSKKKDNLTEAAGALFFTGMLTFLFLAVTAVYDSSLTRVDEDFIAYILIAIAVPLRNSNRLRITLLHVAGKHRIASRYLVKKNILVLIAIWLLSTLDVPSFLIGAFLLAEVYQRITIRKEVRVPGFFRPSFFSTVFKTLNRSLHHLFSGEALNLIFYADLFILGLFVASSQIGVYSEAALFGRFFLLIPVGIRPILHRYFAKLAAADDAQAFSKSVHDIRAYMFYFHALLALFLMIFFADSLHFLLGFYGSEALSYDLFTLMLPGYLFYAAVIVNEAALEASGNAPFLSKISTIIIGINIILNFYFIPFSGIYGAATSTLICLLIYFFTICTVKITIFTKTPLLEYFVAGAMVYLFDLLIDFMDLSWLLFLIAVPPAFYLVLYILNFFSFDKAQSPKKNSVHS